jgi:paraquat-inducible protein B
MKTGLHPGLVGAFVLGALLLGVLALLTFGSTHIFARPGRFRTYFDESVQGLDLGGAVKFRGVRVGRVMGIGLRCNSQTGESMVAVTCELNRNLMTDERGAEIRVTDPATLEHLIRKGPRAWLGLVGITGLHYVELDFGAPQKSSTQQWNGTEPYPVVPTVPSDMSELLANASGVVRRLNQVDFYGISQELRSLIMNANQKTAELDLGLLATKLTAAAGSIEDLASSCETKAAVTNLNRAMLDTQALLTNLNARVQPTSAEFVQTLHIFNGTANRIQAALAGQGGLGAEAISTLQHLAEMSESIQELAEFLERNPNALLTGKRRPARDPSVRHEYSHGTKQREKDKLPRGGPCVCRAALSRGGVAQTGVAHLPSGVCFDAARLLWLCETAFAE